MQKNSRLFTLIFKFDSYRRAITDSRAFWVAQFDFPEPMNYFQARAYAQSLGPRWDLPSRRQAKVMMLYKDSLLEMNEDSYWIRLSS
ncbi:MAG: hypothetical protein ACJ0QP_05775 [Schleiferiaceae bacterium]